MRSINFDQVADDYDATRGGEARGRQFAPDLARFLRADRPAFEIGVGTGVIGLALRALGLAVCGLDISADMLRRARNRLGDVLVRADATQLPVRTNSLDQAYSVWVLHVVADPALVMREVKRVLKPGGRYLVMDGALNDDPDDPFVEAMHEIEAGLGISRRAGRARMYAEVAAACGLRVADLARTGPYPFTTSILESAERLGSRCHSWAWDVPDDVWERVVVPVVERLKSLPGAGEPVTHRDYQEVLVLER